MKKDTRKLPSKRIWILIIIALILIPFFLFQNKHLVITNYTYESDKLSPDLDGYRIVQISDLHNATFGKNNRKLLDAIKSCSPDMIVLTGDLVDSNHTNVKRAVSFVEQAVTIAPVYYVTGNHEYWLTSTDRQQTLQGILSAGAIDLDNLSVPITRGDSSFLLVGLDDHHLSDETLKRLLTNQNELSSSSPMNLNICRNMRMPVQILSYPVMLMADSSVFPLSAVSLHRIRDFCRNIRPGIIQLQIPT